MTLSEIEIAKRIQEVYTKDWTGKTAIAIVAMGLELDKIELMKNQNKLLLEIKEELHNLGDAAWYGKANR